MTIFLGLDTAIVTGYALYQPAKNRAFVIEVKGNPIQQFEVAVALISEMNEAKVMVVFEKMHNFRSATTTRSLLERYGYLKWSLIMAEMEVQEVSPGMARAFLGCRGKREVLTLFTSWFVGAYLTTNHCDALAVALYAANQCNPKWGTDIPMISGVGELELDSARAIEHIERSFQ